MLTNQQTLKLLMEQNRYVLESWRGSVGANTATPDSSALEVTTSGFLFGLRRHGNGGKEPRASTSKCHFASLGKQTSTPPPLMSQCAACCGVQGGSVRWRNESPPNQDSPSSHVHLLAKPLCFFGKRIPPRCGFGLNEEKSRIKKKNPLIPPPPHSPSPFQLKVARFTVPNDTVPRRDVPLICSQAR